jgi:outer membrane biosynthesis protein TonB
MKKLFLIIAAAAFMVACAPKAQPVVDTPEEDIVVVDDATDEVVPDQPATPAKPKPTTPTAPKEEPKVEEPVKEEPAPVKEEPKAGEPKTNEGVKRR